MKKIRTKTFLIVLILLKFTILLGGEKSRLIVLTDIGGDPDDEQSLVRLLVYANEFDIEGLINKHWDVYYDEGFTPSDQRTLMRSYIYAYGDVRNQLAQNASGYPSESSLLNVMKQGGTNVPCTLDIPEISEVVGTIIGPGKDTDGSNWIIARVDASDSRPVDFAAWGGVSDLAQALWKVKSTRSSSQLSSFVRKIRVYSTDDQDDTGYWIRDNFPDLFFILSKAPNGNKLNSVYRGMYLGGDESLTSRDWVNTHVRNNHGPLGAKYPRWAYTRPNPNMSLKEGDTPSWFYFLDNELNRPDKPYYGGWGGRFRPQSTYWQDNSDWVEGVYSGRATVWRWRPNYQNDFQARLDWCVKSYGNANHNPVANISGDLTRTVYSGEFVRLDASGSYDPDGDNLSYFWFEYSEPGSFSGDFEIENNTSSVAEFTAPIVTSRKSMHIILVVKDNGSPNLVSYKRVILTIKPGSVTYRISGNANYYDNGNPVENTKLLLSGNKIDSVWTDENGDYCFYSLNEHRDYQIEAVKTSDTDVDSFAIISYDAALTAQAAAGMFELTSDQAIAADVDRNGEVTFFDAALISQHVIGFPKPAGSHVAAWEFLPEYLDFYNLSSNKTGKNFKGILLGNVHGGWSNPGSLMGAGLSFEDYNSLRDILVTQGEEFDIPFKIGLEHSIISVDFDFRYDPAVMRFVGLSRSGLGQEAEMFFRREEGRLRVSIFSINPLPHNKDIISLRFEAAGKKGQSGMVSLDRLQLNDNIVMKGSSRVRIEENKTAPRQLNLLQNYPNPLVLSGECLGRDGFGTKIKYELPNGTDVRLTIFNCLGQKVRTLTNGFKQAGVHDVTWYGLDENGEQVSAGIYIYRLETTDQIKKGRLLLLR